MKVKQKTSHFITSFCKYLHFKPGIFHKQNSSIFPANLKNPNAFYANINNTHSERTLMTIALQK